MFFKKKKSAETPDEIMARPWWVKSTGWALAGVFVFMTILGWYWSRTPDIFWVNEKADGDKKE